MKTITINSSRGPVGYIANVAVYRAGSRYLLVDIRDSSRYKYI